MVSPIELFKCWHQILYLIPLRQQSCCEQFASLEQVLILCAGSGITEELWNVNAVCCCRGNIAAQKRKVNYGEVEVIPCVIKPTSELSIVRKQITIQVWRACCRLCCFFYFKLKQGEWLHSIVLMLMYTICFQIIHVRHHKKANWYFLMTSSIAPTKRAHWLCCPIKIRLKKWLATGDALKNDWLNSQRW